MRKKRAAEDTAPRLLGAAVLESAQKPGASRACAGFPPFRGNAALRKQAACARVEQHLTRSACAESPRVFSVRVAENAWVERRGERWKRRSSPMRGCDARLVNKQVHGNSACRPALAYDADQFAHGRAGAGALRMEHNKQLRGPRPRGRQQICKRARQNGRRCGLCAGRQREAGHHAPARSHSSRPGQKDETEKEPSRHPSLIGWTGEKFYRKRTGGGYASTCPACKMEQRLTGAANRLCLPSGLPGKPPLGSRLRRASGCRKTQAGPRGSRQNGGPGGWIQTRP